MRNKILNVKRKLTENRKRALAYLLVGSLIMGLVPMTAAADTTEETHGPLWEGNTGDMNIVPYNNDIRVDVACGGRTTVCVSDYNGDGIMDIVLGNDTVPYCGSLVFYGTENAQKKYNEDGTLNEDYMFMENAVKLTEGYRQPAGSALYEYDKELGKYGKYLKTLFTCWGANFGDAYPNFSSDYSYSLPDFKKNPDPYVQEVKEKVGYDIYKNLNFAEGTITDYTLSGSHTYLDYDGDGDLDLMHVISNQCENGWEYGTKHRYDENGVWGDGDDPHRVWIFWHENTAKDGNNIYATDVTYFENFSNPQLVTYTSEGKEFPVEVFGTCFPSFADFDFDGDLDIVRSDYFGDYHYFENIGSRTEPQYAKGRGILTPDGDILKWEENCVTTTWVDWNQDGYMDMVTGCEDGRVALIEHTGKKSEDGTPIMEEPVCFQMPAEGVKAGMEASPFSVDWDGDGDEDMLVGSAVGRISFVENLSIIEENGENVQVRDLSNPSWAKPVFLRTPDEEIYRITAGDTLVKGANGEYVQGGGSPQGTHEFGWGYTTITVADWDNDGVLDIISNNIWGKVYFHKGIEGDTLHVEEAQPVEVEWENGNISPSWNWWKPEGKELVIPWRSTALAIDLPIDKDGDGVATGDGLVDLVAQDSEGYLAFYERYQSSDGTLKLKQGKRIFQGSNGNPYQIRNGTHGTSGRVKFTLVDYDMDDMLDIIYTDDAGGRNVAFARNMSTTPGEYVFSKGGSVHERKIYDHSVSPTTCDWNGDDVPDLLMGAEDGHIYYLINNVVEKKQEEPDVDDINDSLVAHWDFEGDADTTALEDKATAGTADNLDIGGTPGNITIEDGIATLTGNGAFMADDSLDLAPSSKMTIFMKAYIEGSGAACLISKAGSNYNSRVAYKLDVWESGRLNFSLCKDSWDNPLYGEDGVGPERDTWREIAIVLDQNQDGYVTAKAYVSKYIQTSTGADFNLLWEHPFDITEPLNTSLGLIIGNEYDPGNPTLTLTNSNVTRKFDDVRIYNRALTPDQLAGLIDDNKSENGLIAHWDFEGTDDATRLADKANGKNPLSLIQGTTGGVSFADEGKATITGNSYLKAAAAGLNDTESMTVFMRVKVSALGWYKFLRKMSSSGAGFALGPYPDGNGLMLSYKSNYFANNSIVANEWREIAIVVNKDARGFYNYGLLISKNEATADGGDFVSYVSYRSPVAEHVAASADLLIGNDGGTSVTRVFDDIQIYKRALTSDELAALINPNDLAVGENDTTSYYLASLDNNMGFSFFDYRTNYTAETYKDAITITPVADDAGVVIKVNDAEVVSGTAKTIALQEGNNTITIKVGDGTTTYRTYTVAITRNPLMTEKLATLIEQVGRYENTGYDAWNAFATVLSQAEALLALTNPSDGELTDVYNALVAAEKQLFDQENLPAVSLKGFKHVTLDDFGIESKTYTGGFYGYLSHANDLDKTMISMHVDFEKTGNSSRIDIGNGFYVYARSNDLAIFTLGGNVIPDLYDFIEMDTLREAGLTTTLDKFFMQMSFEYMDYNGDGTKDGMHVNMYVNGLKVYSRDMKNCKLSSLSSELQLRNDVDYPVTVDSVIGDAHGDGVLDTRDLVAVLKATHGADLGSTYENTVADVDMTKSVNKEDATELRSKLLK